MTLASRSRTRRALFAWLVGGATFTGLCSGLAEEPPVPLAGDTPPPVERQPAEPTPPVIPEVPTHPDAPPPEPPVPPTPPPQPPPQPPEPPPQPQPPMPAT